MNKDIQELMSTVTEITSLRTKYVHNGMLVETITELLSMAIELEKVRQLGRINHHLVEISEVVMSWEENRYGKR